jgi:hypothetical protein
MITFTLRRTARLAAPATAPATARAAPFSSTRPDRKTPGPAPPPPPPGVIFAAPRLAAAWAPWMVAAAPRGSFRPCSSPFSRPCSSPCSRPFSSTRGAPLAKKNARGPDPRAVSSPGVIFDAYVPSLASAPWIVTPAGFRYWLRRWAGFLRSGLAAHKIRKAVPAFAPDACGDLAENVFRRVDAAYYALDRRALEALVTPQLAPGLKYGMKRRWALFNTEDAPLRLSKMMGVPEMQQMRVVNVDRDDKDKMFAQITMRMDLEFKLAGKVQEQPQEQEQAAGGGGGSNAGGRKRKKQSKNKSKELTDWLMPNDQGMRGSGDRGEWMQDADESGRVYYWHTKTMETRWDKPDAFGVVAATSGEGGNAVRLHDLGGPGRKLPKEIAEEIGEKEGKRKAVEGEAVEEDEDGDGEEEEEEGQMFYYKSTYCVLERDLSKGEQGSWRVCKL